MRVPGCDFIFQTSTTETLRECVSTLSALKAELEVEHKTRISTEEFSLTRPSRSRQPYSPKPPTQISWPPVLGWLMLQPSTLPAALSLGCSALGDLSFLPLPLFRNSHGVAGRLKSIPWNSGNPVSKKGGWRSDDGYVGVGPVYTGKEGVGGCRRREEGGIVTA